LEHALAADRRDTERLTTAPIRKQSPFSSSSPFSSIVAKYECMNEMDDLQMNRYRQMSGEERLRIGLGLFESAVDVAREAVRHQFPNADKRTIEYEVQRRIRIGYEIQRRTEST
jgi:hypothetical protein